MISTITLRPVVGRGSNPATISTITLRPVIFWTAVWENQMLEMRNMAFHKTKDIIQENFIVLRGK